MATESFMKDITIRKAEAGKRLVFALENAYKKAGKAVTLRRGKQAISREKLREFLGEL